jgi:hypothetical protein
MTVYRVSALQYPVLGEGAIWGTNAPRLSSLDACRGTRVTTIGAVLLSQWNTFVRCRLHGGRNKFGEGYAGQDQQCPGTAAAAEPLAQNQE